VYEPTRKDKSYCLRALLVAAGINLLSVGISVADNNQVALVEDDSSECLANDGKLILLKSEADTVVEVWLDRWFMGVQTADHTKHTLKPGDEAVALGCSQTRDKEKQHWTIASVKAL